MKTKVKVELIQINRSIDVDDLELGEECTHAGLHLLVDCLLKLDHIGHGKQSNEVGGTKCSNDGKKKNKYVKEKGVTDNERVESD
jgi:hypothetical protein